MLKLQFWQFKTPDLVDLKPNFWLAIKGQENNRPRTEPCSCSIYLSIVLLMNG